MYKASDRVCSSDALSWDVVFEVCSKYVGARPCPNNGQNMRVQNSVRSLFKTCVFF